MECKLNHMSGLMTLRIFLTPHGVAWNHDTDGNSVTLTQGGAPGPPSVVTSGYFPLPSSEFVSRTEV